LRRSRKLAGIGALYIHTPHSTSPLTIAPPGGIAIFKGMPVARAPSTAVHRAWLFVALRGALAVVVAAVVLTRPAMGRALLVGTIGAYLFIDGLLALGIALRAERGGTGRARYILEGVLSVTVGALAFARPSAVGNAVLILIAARSIIAGLVEIATGISLRHSGGGETHWPIGLAGLASLAFGAFLFARPASGRLVLVLVAGLYILLFGLSLIGAAFRLYRAYGRLRQAAA
jgi:uncharacterized membrane protein HdeD (DUF308 family)